MHLLTLITCAIVSFASAAQADGPDGGSPIARDDEPELGRLANQPGGHPIAISNVVGTILGLGVGAVSAATWHHDLAMADLSAPGGLRIGRIPVPQIAPLAVRGGAGLALVWR